MITRAVFLDKDGTIIEDLPYNVDPRKIRLLPGAAEGLRLLYDAGYRLFVVTNQPGMAQGYFTEQDMARVAHHLRRVLAEAGAPLSGFYYCPHYPRGVVEKYSVPCTCRKPEPGLIVRAAREHDIHLRSAWLVGDILNDVEAGHRAGCRSILIDNGKETEWELTRRRFPDRVVGDLVEAAAVITGTGRGDPRTGE